MRLLRNGDFASRNINAAVATTIEKPRKPACPVMAERAEGFSMNNCQRCGDPLREGAQLCVGCGTPVVSVPQPPVPPEVRPVTTRTPPRPDAPAAGNRTMAAIAAGALAGALTITVTLLVVQHNPTVPGRCRAAGLQGRPSTRGRSATATSTSTSSRPETTTTRTTTAVEESTIRTYLDAQVAADRAGVERLVCHGRLRGRRLLCQASRAFRHRSVQHPVQIVSGQKTPIRSSGRPSRHLRGKLKISTQKVDTG